VLGDPRELIVSEVPHAASPRSIPGVTGMVLDRIRRVGSGTDDDGFSSLNKRERAILLLVAEGMTNKQIAAEVFLSDKTVKNYVSSILSKLDLDRRAQAAA
jgi:two-component system response regulator DevR